MLILNSGQVPDNPYRFIGGYQHTNLAPYKFGYRYYDPSHGRFTQPDPIGGDPATRADNPAANRYLYSIGSPITYSDLPGTDGCLDDDDCTDAIADGILLVGGTALGLAGGPATAVIFIGSAVILAGDYYKDEEEEE